MKIAGQFVTRPYDEVDPGRLFLFRGDNEITVGMQCVLSDPRAPATPSRRLLVCLGRLGDTAYRPSVRTESPSHILQPGDTAEFVPDVLTPIPDRSFKDGLVYISGAEVHLGVIFGEGLAHLNVGTGELIRHNHYGREDWGCGAWSIQNRSADGSIAELIRFEARLTGSNDAR